MVIWTFGSGDYVEVPSAAFSTISDQITVSFWCYGDPNVMPMNSYIFEGRDANGYRVVNSHLPWSNSRVYWDAGNSSTNSYDRIDEAANAIDFAESMEPLGVYKERSHRRHDSLLKRRCFYVWNGENQNNGGNRNL